MRLMGAHIILLMVAFWLSIYLDNVAPLATYGTFVVVSLGLVLLIKGDKP